ncbi:glycosyltransferase [Bacteroides gallinaceum]|uniref:glycosyltransferase n=1 Tax=Bacteroides gallinaceum TaxID=1462571 RepID=UPI0025AB0D8F|nr:glycosyltransferase [Bacteroides gallinaceum]MDN0066642.1 glycosyltransferase [Bacteroides gallinaceum]
MNTKIVYCTVSGSEDMYLAQAFISIYSARRYNPSATIVLLVDKPTSDVIEKHFRNLKGYVTNVIVANVPEHLNKMERSRYLKTTMREHVDGDFLYIDADTIVTCNLSEIDYADFDMGSVLDRHARISVHVLSRKISNDLKKVNMSLKDLKDKYFNGGVLFVKDTPNTHELFDKWHTIWEETRHKGKPIDQPPLARANMECGYIIHEMDGEWNCQLSDNFLNCFHDAKILHYFASNNESPYNMYENDLYIEVMNKDEIPQNIKDAIENPKSFFKPKHRVIYNDDIDFTITNIHTIFKYHRWLFNMFEYVAKVIVRKRL